MANIMSLSNELLHSVLEYIYDSSESATIGSLTLVNRRFNTIANYRFTYRHLDIKNGLQPELVHEWITNPNRQYILDSIRSITIYTMAKSEYYKSILKDWTIPKDRRETIIWKPVADLIANLKYLKRLSYKNPQPCPLILIDAIEKYQPRAHLEIYDWGMYGKRMYRYPDPHLNSHNLALAKLPSLRKISTAFTYNRDDWYDFRDAALNQILALAPNLETVHLKRSVRNLFNFQRLSPAGINEFTQFTGLFNVENPVRKEIKEIKQKGYLHLSADWIAQWDRLTDLSRLESLQQSGTTMYTDFFVMAIAQNTFSSLKCLGLDVFTFPILDPNLPAAINQFLLSCAPLESLTLRNRRDSVPLSTILDRHGQSLRVLHLHGREAARTPDRYNNFLPYPRAVFSLTNIQQIRDACPRLDELTVDIDRTVSTGSERRVYALLATFPNLTKITLCYDVGLAHVTRPTLTAESSDQTPFLPPPFQTQYPVLDDQFVANVYGSISFAKLGAPLEALHVKAGEKYMYRGGFSPAWEQYENEHCQEFSATPCQRDDRKGQVRVTELTRNGETIFNVTEVWPLRATGSPESVDEM